MHCQSCKFNGERFCAVNPTHMQGGWSTACEQHEHDESKVIKCGNCFGFRKGYCISRHLLVSESEKCADFLPHEEVADAYEWNHREMLWDAMLNIKVSINMKNGELILLK